MKIKLNLLSFLLPLYEMEMGDGGGVGIAAPDPAVIAAADPPSAQETSEEPQASVTGSEDVTAQQQTDPLEGLPTLDELKKQAEAKVPYAAGLANVVEAYERAKAENGQYAPWKEVVDSVGDPIQAKTAYELVQSLRTPVDGHPNEFTARPFLERVDQERPGSANQIFHDLLTYEVPDEKGQVDTLVRHMYRSHGLDPDRIDDYRNIDTLRASGVVSAEDLRLIPAQYQDAFRSLSQDGQDDILELLKARDTSPSYGLRAEEHLRNAQDALEARQWREQNENAQREAATRQHAELQQQVAEVVETDIFSEVKTIHDSIYQNLSSQFTFSSDATQNTLEHSKIMATLATLQNPAYRFVAENALKSVGVTLNGFDELANRWEVERSKFVAFKAAGQENTWDAREALSKSTVAKQQILAKLNDYALKLAQASGERASGIATQKDGQLSAATSRYVPSGAGQVPQRGQNPFKNNPYTIGTPEYSEFIRKIEKEYNVDSAALLG